MSESLTYAGAGVDVHKANALVESIKKIAKQTNRPGVMGSIGGFGGLFSPNLSSMEKPVLVSSTDGVGTKLNIAFQMGKHDTVGIDLVGMCVNDIAVQGAEPLFFLDYISMGHLDTGIAKAIIEGVAEGCRQARCALIGGETAEMPGMYGPGEYDLAGFAVGAVDDHKIVDGSEIHVGHKIVGIASTGLHSNGFSLVRKICFEKMKLTVESHVPEFGKTLGEELLTPTRIYSDLMQGMLKSIKVDGFAHITGGGLDENIIRVIPNACKAVLKKDSWEIPPVFSWLKEAGNVADAEMMRTFNNGIGLAVVVPEEYAQALLDMLEAMNVNAWLIGEIDTREDGAPQVEWV
ncbi:phosphoribosylformylglycinamidine cyclo-ligase [Desulfoluna spongiiphila]|uniref:phosphoribosylformylglycinamidine cyclo-ligase n=1 Tax=Desulfoluna spongiiphila TaxID=419481 RepID=UPI001259C0F1|nr:phosphoribosylformylglycinamidine cyclo-ligase [Desulfoluna spongiiphila]VVS90908.1 phosphoribosylformylglycinamidine cyclo-ligase [Desulfoluna spongiiphila]